MTRPLEPGVFTATFTRLAARSQVTGAAAMTSLALAIERQAKLDLGRSSHPRGTKTTASRGGPPALVSGTLRRAVTHSRPAVTAAGVEVRVGVAAGVYPPYPKRGTRTPASKYGLYLETGHYPWLVPAFHKVTGAGGVAQIARYFRDDWVRS
jgi:hypothetical protein